MRCLNFFVCGSSSRSETVDSERSKTSKTLPILQRRGSSVSSTPHSSFSWPSSVTSFDSSTNSLPPPPPTPSQIPSNQIISSAFISLRTTDPGVCLSLLGKDTLLCTSSQDQSLKVLNSTDLSTISTLANAKSPVKSLLVSGTTVFTGHQDLKIRVWELILERNCNKLKAVLPTFHDRLITSMLPNSHVQTRRHKTELRIQHFDSISALALGAAGTLLYSASWDKSIKVWSLSTYRCIESFKAHEDAVNSLAVTTDGFLYSASTDGSLKAWERAGAENKHLLTATFQTHGSGVNALALSSDELFLYSASSDRSVIVWEREDSADHMSVSQVLKGHSHAVLCLSTAGHVLCSGSADRTIRVWRRHSRGTGGGKVKLLHWCIGVLETQAGPVRSVATSESLNMCRVYGASVDGSVKAWLVSVGSILAGTVEHEY